ncbi:hypothetical protein YC2023_047992 [Brassica napus]
MQREKKSKEKFLGLKTGKVETLGKFFKKGRVMLERDRILIPLCVMQRHEFEYKEKGCPE